MPSTRRFLSIVALVNLCFAQLPPFTGPYQVGVIDIEVPVPPRNISRTLIANTSEPAFLLETLLFTLFYPTNATTSPSPPHPWIPPPMSLVAQGLSTYLTSTNSSISPDLISLGLSAFAGSLTVPALVDVPLLAGGEEERLPVVVFSHGQSSLGSWYGEFVGSLASRGGVVGVSVQHRDGSAPGTQVVRGEGEGVRNVTFYLGEELSPPLNATELVQQQRDMRQAEIEGVIAVLRNITNGGGAAVAAANTRNEGQSLGDWTNRLDLDNLIISGHSLGATSQLQVLSQAQDSAISAKGGILFDPGKESGPLPTNTTVPLLIPDSEEWSSTPTQFYGQQHFDTVKTVAQNALDASGASWFLTLLGSSHTTITDAALLPANIASLFASGSTFNASINASVALDQYVTASVNFIDYLRNGSREGVLAAGVTYPEFGQANQSAVEAAPKDVNRFWQVHVAPPMNESSGANGTGGSGGSGNGTSGGGGNGGSAASALEFQVWILLIGLTAAVLVGV